MKNDLPTIVISPAAPQPTSSVASALMRSGEWPWDTIPQTGRLLHVLIEEGRRFAATPRGKSWQMSLMSLDLVSKGWAAWNLLELDSVVAAGAGETDTLGALHADLYRAFAEAGAGAPGAGPDGAALG